MKKSSALMALIIVLILISLSIPTASSSDTGSRAEEPWRDISIIHKPITSAKWSEFINFTATITSTNPSWNISRDSSEVNYFYSCLVEETRTIRMYAIDYTNDYWCVHHLEVFGRGDDWYIGGSPKCKHADLYYSIKAVNEGLTEGWLTTAGIVNRTTALENKYSWFHVKLSPGDPPVITHTQTVFVASTNTIIELTGTVRDDLYLGIYCSDNNNPPDNTYIDIYHMGVELAICSDIEGKYDEQPKVKSEDGELHMITLISPRCKIISADWKQAPGNPQAWLLKSATFDCSESIYGYFSQLISPIPMPSWSFWFKDITKVAYYFYAIDRASNNATLPPGNQWFTYTPESSAPFGAFSGPPSKYFWVDITHDELNIHGKVKFLKDSTELALEKAKVTLFLGKKAFTVYTDEHGEYKFSKLPVDSSTPDKAYIVVNLTDENNTIQIIDREVSSTEPAIYKTNSFSIKSGGRWLKDIEKDIVFPNRTDDPATQNIREDHLDDLAFMYWATYKAVKFYRDKLGVTFGSGGLCNHTPVRVYAYNSGDGVYFNPSDGAIYIGRANGSSDIDTPDAPQNREWHEFSHYVQWDVYEELPPKHTWVDGIGMVHEIDANHGGFPNHCTSDSWVEGFAEFMAMAIDNWFFNRLYGIYPVGDTKILLEPNIRDDQPIKKLGGRTYEEVSVASILWDLYDSFDKREINDHVELKIEQLWAVMTQRRNFTLYYEWDATKTPPWVWVGDSGKTENRHIHYVKDLYDALVAAGYNVNDIFISHGYYSDSNRNNRYDKGEDIGYGDVNRPERRNMKIDPSSSVLINLPPNLVPATLVVNISFSPPYESYEYEYEVKITKPSQSVLIWMPPIDYECRVRFVIKKEGYKDSKAFTFTNAYYWENVGLNDHVANHTFTIKKVEEEHKVDLQKTEFFGLPVYLWLIAIVIIVAVCVIIGARKSR